MLMIFKECGISAVLFILELFHNPKNPCYPKRTGVKIPRQQEDGRQLFMQVSGSNVDSRNKTSQQPSHSLSQKTILLCNRKKNNLILYICHQPPPNLSRKLTFAKSPKGLRLPLRMLVLKIVVPSWGMRSVHVVANLKIHWAARKKRQPEAGRRRVPPLLFCCPFGKNSCTSPAALGGSLSWETSASPTRSSVFGLSAPHWSATRPPWVQSDVPQEYASCSKPCKGRKKWRREVISQTCTDFNTH